MKHPALARIFSIALALLCLIMLLAGAFGISGARKDNEDILADYDRLQGRIEEYNTVTQALKGTISYEEANRTLEELQEQHDSDASQHKNDLALYTATKGGLETGREALWSAQGTLEEAWEQYNAGRAKFDEMYDAFIAGKQAVEGNIAQANALNAQLDGLLALQVPAFPDAHEISMGGDPGTGGEGTGDNGGDSGEIPDSGDEGEGDPEEGDGEEAPDAGGETEGEDAAKGENAKDEGNGSSGEEGGMAANMAAGASSGLLVSPLVSRPGGSVRLVSAGVPGEMPAMSVYYKDEVVAAYDGLFAAYDELESFIDGTSAMLAGLSATGQIPENQAGTLQDAQSSMEKASQGIQQIRSMALQPAYDGLSALDAPMIPAQAASGLVTAYNTGKSMYDAIRGQMGSMKALFSVMNTMLSEAKAQIDAGEPELLKGKAALDQAKAALEKGDAQIHVGWDEIWKTMGELDEKAEELQLSKDALEQEAQELAAMEAETRQQRDLEKRQTSLRVMLMDRKGIEERVDGGMELIESAEAYGEQLRRDAQNEYQTRFIACILMIIGGLAGISHIPSAFEKLKSRFVLVAPVVICLACAAAAEYIFEHMGRGSSYSAIFAGIFAVIQLLVILPQRKNKLPKAE